VVKGSRADEVVAAHPFFTHFDSFHRGVVLLRFHGEGLLDQASVEALHVSIVQAFVLLALFAVLWLVLDFLVTGRVRWLLEQAREYGNGGATTQVLEGDDELSQVSQAFANAVEHVQQKEVQLLEAAEEERRRIGSDLHDDVCQRITAAQLKSGVLHSALCREQHPKAELAGSVADELAKTTCVARGFARGLAPMLVEPGRLVESLREMASTISESFSVPCECQCRLDGRPLALWVETHVFRIMQELMTNAVKHARPSRVCGLVEVDGTRLILMVENDGEAFEQESVVHGLGLDLVRQRVRALGGVFSVTPGEGGHGCRATCSVALSEQHYLDAEDAGA
jgi:signal transduction histidine kinase